METGLSNKCVLALQDVALFQQRTVQFLLHMDQSILQHVDHVAHLSMDYTPELLGGYMTLFCNAIRLQLLAASMPKALIIQLYTLVVNLCQVSSPRPLIADLWSSWAVTISVVVTCTLASLRVNPYPSVTHPVRTTRKSSEHKQFAIPAWKSVCKAGLRRQHIRLLMHSLMQLKDDEPPTDPPMRLQLIEYVQDYQEPYTRLEVDFRCISHRISQVPYATGICQSTITRSLVSHLGYYMRRLNT